MTTEKIDTSLLPALFALLKHKNVTQAAQEMFITQSAMSKTLTKARQSFSDELLVRSGRGYILTKKGERVLLSLEQLMPQLAALWSADTLNLKTAQQTIRIAGTDMDIAVCSDRLNNIMSQAPQASMAVSLSGENSVEALRSGELEFLMTAFDVESELLERELMWESDYVVVASGSTSIKSLDMQTYLSAEHAAFQLSDARKTAVDNLLNAQGIQRNVVLWTATFSHAIKAVLGSERTLLLTIPRNFLQELPLAQSLRTFPVPFQMHTLKIYLYWHRRINSDPFMEWVKQQLLKAKK